MDAVGRMRRKGLLRSRRHQQSPLFYFMSFISDMKGGQYTSSPPSTIWCHLETIIPTEVERTKITDDKGAARGERGGERGQETGERRTKSDGRERAREKESERVKERKGERGRWERERERERNESQGFSTLTRRSSYLLYLILGV